MWHFNTAVHHVVHSSHKRATGQKKEKKKGQASVLTHDCFLSPQHRETHITACVCLRLCDKSTEAWLERRPSPSADTDTATCFSREQSSFCFSLNFFLHWNKCEPPRKTHGCRHTSRPHTDHSHSKSTASQLCVRVYVSVPATVDPLQRSWWLTARSPVLFVFFNTYNLSLHSSERTKLSALMWPGKNQDTQVPLAGFFSFAIDQKSGKTNNKQKKIATPTPRLPVQEGRNQH